MVGTPSGTHSEGLKAARLCMVLGSISPLFIFWAIQGSSFIADGWLVAFCAFSYYPERRSLSASPHGEDARRQARAHGGNV